MAYICKQAGGQAPWSKKPKYGRGTNNCSLHKHKLFQMWPFIRHLIYAQLGYPVYLLTQLSSVSFSTIKAAVWYRQILSYLRRCLNQGTEQEKCEKEQEITLYFLNEALNTCGEQILSVKTNRVPPKNILLPYLWLPCTARSTHSQTRSQLPNHRSA